jgi:hypothetical protein
MFEVMGWGDTTLRAADLPPAASLVECNAKAANR